MAPHRAHKLLSKTQIPLFARRLSDNPHLLSWMNNPLFVDELKKVPVLPHQSGLRLDRFITTYHPWLSRTQIQSKIRDGLITVDGTAVKPSRRIREGETVTISTYRVPEATCTVQPDEITVIAEDEHFVAVSKPPGIVVHPASGHLHHNVLTFLQARYPTTPLRLLHRLDNETSGVLLLSKSTEFHAPVAAQFEARSVTKIYFAIVTAPVQESGGIISLPLGRDFHSKVMIRQGIDWENGRRSVTWYTVLARRPNKTLLYVVPKTGRRHQIRAHLSLIGYPIAGDKIYGGDESLFIDYFEKKITPCQTVQMGIDRQALHAAVLSFLHPLTKRPLVLRSPMPQDMISFFYGEHCTKM